MSTTITAAEAARCFPDLLDRVQQRGESFLIVRSGQEIAQLTGTPLGKTEESSPPRQRQGTLRALVERLHAVRTEDPDFADDLERIQAEQPPLSEDPWAT